MVQQSSGSLHRRYCAEYFPSVLSLGGTLSSTALYQVTDIRRVAVRLCSTQQVLGCGGNTRVYSRLRQDGPLVTYMTLLLVMYITLSLVMYVTPSQAAHIALPMPLPNKP